LLPLLLTNQGQKLSLPFGHGTKGQSTFGFTSVKQAKVVMVMKVKLGKGGLLFIKIKREIMHIK
jgi:hypothetical protein